jgi:hypothetical protein
MIVNTRLRDRMTEPHPVLDPLFEPQKLDGRKFIHLRPHFNIERFAARLGSAALP